MAKIFDLEIQPCGMGAAIYFLPASDKRTSGLADGMVINEEGSS